jgi:hypothetical protein
MQAMTLARPKEPPDPFFGERVHLTPSRTRDRHRLGRIAKHQTPQHRLTECPVQTVCVCSTLRRERPFVSKAA